MGLIAAWNALLSANADGWKKGFGEARAEVDKTEAKTNGYLKNLKANFGKGSQLGQILKLAAGGGAIAGLGLAAREFGSLGEAIGQASINMRTGVQGSSQAMLDSIPIIGNVAKGWSGILEAMTGDEAAWQNQHKKMDDLRKDAQKTAAELQKLNNIILNEGRRADKMARDNAVSAMADGLEKQQAAAQAKFEDTRDDIEARRQAALKSSGVDYDTIQPMQSRYSDMYDKSTSDAKNLLYKITGLKEKAADINKSFAREDKQNAAALEIDKTKNVEKSLEERHNAENDAADKLIEEHKKQQETMKRTEVRMMEDRRDQLQDIASMAHPMAHQGSAISQEFRGGAVTVQAQPTIGKSAQQKAAEDAVKELKELNTNIKQLQRGDSEPAVAVAF